MYIFDDCLGTYLHMSLSPHWTVKHLIYALNGICIIAMRTRSSGSSFIHSHHTMYENITHPNFLLFTRATYFIYAHVLQCVCNSHTLICTHT